MQLPVHTCSFKGGMNKDLSYNEYPNVCYYDAENFRVITDSSEGMSSTSLVTPMGNKPSFTLPSNMVFMGYVVLRDFLIVLAHDTISLVKPDKIYKIALSDIINPGATPYAVLPGHFHLGGNLIYEETLNFNVLNPIRVVANYENADVQKIYWVDGINTLKHLNLIHNDIYNDLTLLDPQLLDVIPYTTYGTYTLTEDVGGHLRAGRIQYSYQLYSISGSETMFAPPSNLYNLTNYNISDGIEFVGNELETEINKSIRITITLPVGTADIFNRIRLVALTYEEYNDTPIVRVVAEQELNTDTPIITDYGNSIGELVLEEFQVIKNDLIPKTIESKNNYLFAANLTEEFFDVDELAKELSGLTTTFVDTRAYRWRYALTGGTSYGSQIMSELTDPTYTVIDGQPGFEIQKILGVSQISLTDSQWYINVLIGSVAHAAVQAPVRTVTSASITGAFMVLYLHHNTGGWSPLPLFLTGLGGSYHTWAPINKFYAYGFSYAGTKPSGMGHPISEYDEFALVSMSYTYNYSYLSPATSVECILNKGITGVVERVVDSGAGPDYTIVPEDDDCINIYNNISNDTVGGHEYKYRYPFTTPGAAPVIGDLGGTGPYISYGFTYKDIVSGEKDVVHIDSTLNIPILISGSTTYGYQDPQNVLDYTGYQRDEVYRFGIVFYDLKGRPSFTKWIGDIRFPNNLEELVPATTWNGSYLLTAGTIINTQMISRALGLEFTIDWDAINIAYPGLLAQLSGFQIVRVPRTDNDCTIKAQGIVLPTHHPHDHAGAIEIRDSLYSSFNITSAYDYNNDIVSTITDVTAGHSTLNQKVIELISPEIAINKQLTTIPGDFIEIWGHLAYVDAVGGQGTDTTTKEYGVSATGCWFLSPEYIDPVTPESTAYHLANDWRREISDSFISPPEKRYAPSKSIGVWTYTARGFSDQNDANHPEMSYKGTSLVMHIDNILTNVQGALTIPGGEEAMCGRYRRSLGYSIYGGSTYKERTYNSYIKVSDFTTLPTNLIATPTVDYELYNGDIYINPFCFVKLFMDEDAEYRDDSVVPIHIHSGQVFVSFPVESKINTAYLMPSTPLNIDLSSNIYSNFSIAETQSIGISQYPSGYPEIGDLYRYNSAYSAVDVSKVYPSKPFDFRSSVDKDVLITSSDPKINGEYSDSWLDFKFNNYIELEGEYGGITRLINNSDRLMAFQPRGIAVLSVNERELVQTNNTAALAVGDGGILSRYDYLSRTVGTSLYDAICPTELGIYFYSDKVHGIYRILDQLEAISDTKGMKSYFESTPWTECRTAYDKANREILFTPATGDTLVFSGYIDAFTGFYTFCPEHYITFDKYLISSLLGNSFYLHNIGNWTEYYGIDQTSTLTLIANPGKTNVATFHIAEWITDLTDNTGREIQNLTFDELQITNTYQDTDIIDLSTYSDLQKRFRKWRINTLRSGDKGRLRDSWVKAVFTFYQTYNNRKLVVHPINFMYLPTKLY